LQTELFKLKRIIRIFLKKKTIWNDGRSVLPADPVEFSSIRQKFSFDILGKKVAIVKACG